MILVASKKKYLFFSNFLGYWLYCTPMLKAGTYNLLVMIKRFYRRFFFYLGVMLIGSVLYAGSIDSWGTSLVSKETNSLVQKILHEIGISVPVQIRQINSETIKKAGYDNAFAVKDEAGKGYIFLNEPWFNTLTMGEKRYLIGHEAVHLLHEHGASRVKLNNALEILKKYYHDFGISISGNAKVLEKIGFSGIAQAITSLFSRGKECEADIEAVKNCIVVKEQLHWLNVIFENEENIIPQSQIFLTIFQRILQSLNV